MAGDAGAALRLCASAAPGAGRRSVRRIGPAAACDGSRPGSTGCLRRGHDGGHRAHHADGRAGRLPALHARAPPRRRWRWWAAGWPSAAPAGCCRRAEDAGRRAAAWLAIGYRCRPTARSTPTRCTSSPTGVFSRHRRPGGGGHGGVRGRLAAQDQRHQRLRRLAGLVELLRAPHAQPPGPRGVDGVQHADRADADGDERVPGARHVLGCTPTSPSPG